MDSSSCNLLLENLKTPFSSNVISSLSSGKKINFVFYPVTEIISVAISNYCLLGTIFIFQEAYIIKMNYNMGSPKLELKLNLSPPRSENSSSPRTSFSSMELSPPSSCVSREPSPEDEHNMLQCPSSPETTPMMLVGCPRCLMYVMLSGVDPKCPKCKSTFLLDFFQEERTIKKSAK